MRIHDITLTLSADLPVWPGDPPISLTRVMQIETGDEANVTKLEMTVHAGTHVDAPYHFLGGDNPTVEYLPLDVLVGSAYVLQLPDAVDLITAEVLRRHAFPPRIKRLLFKTRNSHLWQRGEKEFQNDFVAVNPDGAQFLVEREVKLVGVDYLSIAPYQDGTPTHRILLEAGIVVLEGLNLAQVAPGNYTLYALPLKIAEADGAPARVILIED